jgi:hypothetical protein
MVIRKIVRIRLGPRRSRVRVGPWPFIFFLAAAITLGAIAIALNIAIEERWKAYRTILYPPAPSQPQDALP